MALTLTRTPSGSALRKTKDKEIMRVITAPNTRVDIPSALFVFVVLLLYLEDAMDNDERTLQSALSTRTS